MTLGGIIEALGLGATRDARLLVARLPMQTGLTVATADEHLARALGRAQHRRALLDAQGEADAALAMALPDGDEGLALVERLAAATREGGLVLVALGPGLGRGEDRPRAAGLFLRAGLVDLRQDLDSGVLVTSGRVHRGTAAHASAHAKEGER